jgi:hypothetical protein
VDTEKHLVEELALFGQHGVDAGENLSAIRRGLSGLQVDQGVDAFEVGSDFAGLTTA